MRNMLNIPPGVAVNMAACKTAGLCELWDKCAAAAAAAYEVYCFR